MSSPSFFFIQKGLKYKSTIMSIFDKIFGDANEKFIKSVQPTIEEINSLEPEFEKIPSEKLKEKTSELKDRLARNETLDGILPEAFALVREAAKRTLKQRHFDVQLVGGIVLHQGKIAEMRTGEGKTLVATLPLYLNALEGKGCHLVTVNDYLARLHAVWMGQIYDLLGLTCGCIIHEQSFLYDPNYKKPDVAEDKIRDELGSFRVVEDYLRPCSRKEAYAADITYGTNNEYGFDYLKDNMAYDLAQQSQRGFNFAIVDEVDSILIDEARTPLIISAPDQESSKWYQDFARIIPRLDPATDYEIDEKMKAVTLTEGGINKIEKILGSSNIYEEKGVKYLHHLEQALRAEALFKKDRDYVVKNGEVIIVDEFTGRLMPGRRWSGGLHQAVEAKEGVQVQAESMTLASVTFQNYFRMYKKLAGMTGTAATSAEEFFKVYKLDTVIIPTNKPAVRKDLQDKIYKNEAGKYKALVKEIKERHLAGQPVLVGTRSVEKNEYLGKLLDIEGVPHQILNAKYHEKEGEIIAQAGKFGQVTIATNMAGRGVDIILGGNPPMSDEADKVRQTGGLHVIGTERHDARRIDNQLRGRAGRQGDPGSSQFFVSLEDDLMRIFGGDRIKSLMGMLKIPEDEPIQAGILSRSLEEAQSKIEGFNFDSRKNVLDYDDVLNKHREVIYKKRREILENAQNGTLRNQVSELVKKVGFTDEDYQNRERELGSENMRQVERIISLRVLDMLWMEHLENMDYLRDAVRLRGYGQQDPLVEYKNEGHKAFSQLLQNFEQQAANTIMKAQVTAQPKTPEFVQPAANPSQKEVGRNDLCPCGSGKKYKKCHGK
jgi:preprotein translocase subunit SecA